MEGHYARTQLSCTIKPSGTGISLLTPQPRIPPSRLWRQPEIPALGSFPPAPVPAQITGKRRALRRA